MWLLGVGLGLLALREQQFRLRENQARRSLYRQAHAYAHSRQKPLLVVGVPKARYSPVKAQYGCGDVTLDLDPIVRSQCPVGGTVANIKAIPAQDKEFGAVFVSHVLEHMRDIPEFRQAWAELNRVGDRVYVAYPHRQGLLQRLYPVHFLMMEPTEGGWKVEEIHTGRKAIIN